MCHYLYDWEYGDDLPDALCPSNDSDPSKGNTMTHNIVNRQGKGNQQQHTSVLDTHNIGSTHLMHNPLGFEDTWERVERGKKGEAISPLLFDLFTLATPHEHESRLFPIMKKATSAKLNQDKYGNVWTVVGPEESPETMFSCHMDTVHADPWDLHIFKTGGSAMPDMKKDFIFAARHQTESELKHAKDKEKEKNILKVCVLGADDKVGIYIMIRMINAKIPGLYMFHVGEERGGKGSRAVAGDTEMWKEPRFRKLKRAIAFDRKDYGDIINHQSCGQCCSSDFTTALAKTLNERVAGILGDKFDAKYRWRTATGSFTDTASYAHLIPECTNLSVGYFNQHTPLEHMDPVWLERVAIPMFKSVIWNELPTARDPKKSYQNSNWSAESDFDGYGAYGGGYRNRRGMTTVLGWADITPDTALDCVPYLPATVLDLPCKPAPFAISKSAARSWQKSSWGIKEMGMFAETAVFQYYYQKERNAVLEANVAKLEAQIVALGVVPTTKFRNTEVTPPLALPKSEDKGHQQAPFTGGSREEVQKVEGLRQGLGAHELPSVFKDDHIRLWDETTLLHEKVEMAHQMGLIKPASSGWSTDIRGITDLLDQIDQDIKEYDQTFLSSNMGDKRARIERIVANTGIAAKEITEVTMAFENNVGYGDMNAINVALREAKTKDRETKKQVPLAVTIAAKQVKSGELIDQVVAQIAPELTMKISKLPEAMQATLKEVDHLLVQSNNWGDRAIKCMDNKQVPAAKYNTIRQVTHMQRAAQLMDDILKVHDKTPEEVVAVLNEYKKARFAKPEGSGATVH